MHFVVALRIGGKKEGCGRDPHKSPIGPGGDTDPCAVDYFSTGCPGDPAYNPPLGETGGGASGEAPWDNDGVALETACGICQLDSLMDARKQSIRTEASRLMALPATDSCNQIGVAMNDNIGLIRTTPYMWRESNGKLASGDYHPTEPSPGAGRIHIAIGINPMNPSRPEADILQSIRHEFGHFIGLPQRNSSDLDPAELLAGRCQ